MLGFQVPNSWKFKFQTMGQTVSIHASRLEIQISAVLSTPSFISDFTSKYSFWMLLAAFQELACEFCPWLPVDFNM